MKEDKKYNFLFFASLGFVIFMILSAFFSPSAKEARKADKDQKALIESILKNGFTPVSSQNGISWDCIKSSYGGKQVVTAEGEYLLFVCDTEYNAYFKLCENGVKIAPLGEHDTCN